MKIYTELRIGNWVNFSRIPTQIEGISRRIRPDCGYFEIVGISNPQKGIHITPIPLTEDWLINFGFKKSIQGTAFFRNLKVYNHLFEPYIVNHKGWHLSLRAKKVAKLEYVHQLQNLYFAITGEELNVKN